MSRLLMSAVVLAATLTFSHIASAQEAPSSSLNPVLKALLQQAASQDDGQHLEAMAKMAIAAYPEAKAAILAEIELLTSAEDTDEEPPAQPATSVAKVEKTPPAVAPSFWRFKSWDGELDVNANYTSGNTDEKSFGTAVKLINNRLDWHHRITAFFDISEKDGDKIKEKFGIGYKADYDLSKRSFLSGVTSYENDNFGPFRERFILSSGYGYRLLTADDLTWDVQAGPNIMFTKDNGGGYQSDYNAQASSLLHWQIAEKTHFDNEVNVFIGGRNVVDTETALKVQINGALHSKLSFGFLYDDDAPAGRKKTDSITRLGVGYNF